LPTDIAIKRVRGTGERVIYLFSDPDCPYCAKFEETLRQVNNVTIYTYLYPIDQLHPNAALKARKIWCAPDRLKAWDAWWAQRALPDNPGTCANPVAKIQALGASLRVNATPTIIMSDGVVAPGAMSPAQLEALFSARGKKNG
jgi:thiol:disulfide interchange protein DsbC